jgi:glutamate/tyrosine decarboxylase-like PLP-dependent enzyme
MAALIGAGHETVAEDELGRLDLDALAKRLGAGGVGTVVATLGTTSLGALDDLEAIAGLCAGHNARLHVDAAYGGFFTLAAGTPDGVRPEPFAAAARADSIVVDPHKHGLQPYGCGCVLFADPDVGRLYTHDSPYTYFTSGDLHLGEISLECSRAGAAAAALWATLRAFPLTADGLGTFVGAARRAARTLAAAVEGEERLALVVEPELDIVCPFARRRSASAISAASERGFDRLAERGWHVAKLRLDTAWLRRRHPWIEADAETTTVLRCCLMKPEHVGVADELAAALTAALAA